jgi:Flp pilus assembly protein TadG
MLLRTSPGARRWKRSGKIIVLFALLLPALLGLTGLVIDGGLLMAAQRQTQNAADAAATAAAMDLLNGTSQSSLQGTATTYVQTYNGLTSAAVTVNNPPQSGSYKGDSHFVEVIVSYPVKTLFIQALGVNSSQTVSARAVAGYEGVSADEGVASLNPNAYPALSVSGNATLKVNGTILVNSIGKGVDQNGNPVNPGNISQGPAASANNNGTLLARTIDVVGGVDNPANFQNYTPGGPSPLSAGRGTPRPDPLENLPTPYTGNVSTNLTSYWGFDQKTGSYVNTFPSPQPLTPSLLGSTPVTLQPGVYQSIAIDNSNNVTFSPGVYVLAGGSGGSALKITGGTVTGNGVMFYNTASSYAPTSATDSTNAFSTTLPTISQSQFGGVTINGGNINLQPISDVNSPFDGMLFYQSRGNQSLIKLAGGSGTTINLAGTLYAEWGNVELSGQSSYNAQFIASTMSVTGGGVVTVNFTGNNRGKANTVFLVE